ncbi:type IV secretory system conjugative DNA transfer family protein [Erysipelothrix sp. HDW6B]|uniref:VirD4-like conjugal transfer protein, CD1115 family n=1 Tax=Erysipelothrix sp. HDW6B TaxID=2714929 RepID=UPI001409B287|nr:type IV secretory system conjugative DNA transfer family protein [Erysipelothrix sp. HDW6B]QIK86638.1 type IV secretory system conjugative DNA transfer family protein [Erysipelothrix sp. HDW6B]
MDTEAIVILSLIGLGLVIIAFVSNRNYNLNSIQSKRVGQGQHGTACFATLDEVKRTYRLITYTPELWRKQGVKSPSQGVIVGYQKKYGKVYALVDDNDVHTLMIGSAGVGKTGYFLYPNLELACASGMSFLCTDTKGDLFRNYATIAEKYYGYKISVIDLRKPLQSHHFNMLHLVNKYMDMYLINKADVSIKAKAEKYAKIIAKTVIYSSGSDMNFGQNQFFYDSAEGLLTATILIIAEYAEPSKRHIVSVFKLIQDLMAPAANKSNEFKLLIDLLPENHKARWFAGASLNTSEQSMQSILSTALARLNTFIDSELEQVLCFDTDIDAETFCNQNSAIFLVLPEEDNTKHFIISLIIQQLYREILSVADDMGGTLKNRVMFYLDEIGTIPRIDSIEMMFSASRSRKLSIVAIIQSLAQLEKNYDKNGAEIIVDNCQLSILGGFAPNSETADVLSKNLGNQTIMSGSVSKGKGDSSQSLQMIERPLMTPDELKSMPKGNFIVMKTGSNPMRSKLELFTKWGIVFEEPYNIKENTQQQVEYVSKTEILKAVTTTPQIQVTERKGKIKLE